MSGRNSLLDGEVNALPARSHRESTRSISLTSSSLRLVFLQTGRKPSPGTPNPELQGRTDGNTKPGISVPCGRGDGVTPTTRHERTGLRRNCRAGHGPLHRSTRLSSAVRSARACRVDSSRVDSDRGSKQARFRMSLPFLSGAPRSFSGRQQTSSTSFSSTESSFSARSQARCSTPAFGLAQAFFLQKEIGPGYAFRGRLRWAGRVGLDRPFGPAVQATKRGGKLGVVVFHEADQ